jgi:hypothetical protein
MKKILIKTGILPALISLGLLSQACNGNANGTSRTDSASPSIIDSNRASSQPGSGNASGGNPTDTIGRRMDSTKRDTSGK